MLARLLEAVFLFVPARFGLVHPAKQLLMHAEVNTLISSLEVSHRRVIQKWVPEESAFRVLGKLLLEMNIRFIQVDVQDFIFLRA